MDLNNAFDVRLAQYPFNNFSITYHLEIPGIRKKNHLQTQKAIAALCLFTHSLAYLWSHFTTYT